MSEVRDEVDEVLRELVRDVPDYPKPGILFKDITPLLADAAALTRTVAALAAPWQTSAADLDKVDKVVGIEARGFILAAPVAVALGVGFVPVRKLGKLPASTLSLSYELEYGAETLEVHADAFEPGERVLVVDDVLATGGTVDATVQLVHSAGATVVGVSVLLELTVLAGRRRLGDIPLRSLLQV